MPCRADTTIDEEVFHQIETSKACGTWVYKKDIEEAALRHLNRMATECGITGESQQCFRPAQGDSHMLCLDSPIDMLG